MKNWHSGFVAAAVVCAGCSKHSEQAVAQPPASSTTENRAQQTSQSQAAPAPTSTQPRQAPAVAAPAPNASPVSAPVNANTANSDAALASLTQAVRKFSFEKRRMPSSVQEVIASGYISPIPQPPPGKKFVLDKKTVQVVLE